MNLMNFRQTDSAILSNGVTIKEREESIMYRQTAGNRFWLKTLFLLSMGFSLPKAWGIDLSQIYFIPLPEDQVQESLKSLSENTGQVITSVTSAVVVGDDTVVIYDHWEDGYEADLGNPVQKSTLVWGDGDPSNGDVSAGGICAPVKACAGDRLRAGATLTLKNDVPVPRDPVVHLWDGRDRIGANKITAVTRAAWAVKPGPVLAGALEVYPTYQYDRRFEVPIGENVPLPKQVEMFEFVDLMVMAGDEPTVVSIDPDGAGSEAPIQISLAPGEGYHTNGGIQMGATLTATQPVQAYIISGNRGARYESRWFTLTPVSRWGSRIFTPVGTAAGAGSGLTYVFLYNPSTNDTLSIRYETLRGKQGTISVPPGTTSHFQMPVESGAQFSSENNAPFFALAAVGVNLAKEENIAHDWGFSLIPEQNLTTQAVVAWGPGSDPSQKLKAGNPLWLTAIRDTKVYIDWGGDGLGQFTAPNGERYDQVISVARLQSVSVMAPDLDNTAARLFTTNGAVFTAAWGQDPSLARTRNPYLDMGTTILPIEVCDFSMRRGERLPQRAISLCCLGAGKRQESQIGQEVVASAIQVDGPTLVSRGSKYVPVSEGMGLRVRERIMALAEGGAYLLFRNGCGYHLAPNEVLTLGEESPCCLAAMGSPERELVRQAQKTFAQETAKTLGAITTGDALIIGGGIITIGGGIIGGGGGNDSTPLEPISR